MAKKKSKKPIDYRALKLALNPYHKFSFKMPRKGRDFSPQQKSAITRKWKKLHNVIEGVEEGKISYIKYSPKRKISRQLKQSLNHTNRGVFIAVRNATVTPKGFIKSEFMDRREIFLPLPKEIYQNPSLIPDWLKQLHEKYFPATIMVSMKDRRGRVAYSPMDAEKYFYEAFMHFGGEAGTRNRINGVFISTFRKEEFKDIYNITEKNYKKLVKGETVRGEPLSFDPQKKKPKYVIKVYDKDRQWFTESHYAYTLEEAMKTYFETLEERDDRFYIVTLLQIKNNGEFTRLE